MITDKHLRELGFNLTAKEFMSVSGITSYWWLVNIMNEKPRVEPKPLPPPQESYYDESGVYHFFINIGFAPIFTNNEPVIYRFAQL